MGYFADGGNLYIESVNLGLDHNGTTFFEDLGLMYAGDGSEQEVIKINGSKDNIASDLNYYCLGGYDPHYSVDRLESNGSQLLFNSEDGFGRMFIKEDAGYRAISSSIILGSLASGDSLNLKEFLLAEMVNTFLGYNPSTSVRELLSGLLNGSNYPNPFTGKTTIEYTLTEAGRVMIDVYDLSGKVVKRLVNDETLPGSYSVTWDATSDNGSLVDDGFYFFKVRQGNHSVTQKMVLLR
jgi:hypothetical protein